MSFRKYPNWKYNHPKVPYIPGSKNRPSKVHYLATFFMPMFCYVVYEGSVHLKRRIKESRLVQKKKEDLAYGRLGFEMMVKSCNYPDNDVIEYFSEF